MPNWELKFWEAKFAKEPPPEVRLEWMLANLTATTVNMNRGKGKKAKKLEKFMLFRDAFKVALSPDKDVAADIDTISEGLGGNVIIEKRVKSEGDLDSEPIEGTYLSDED